MKNENETQITSPKRLTSEELVKGKEYQIYKGPEKGIFDRIENGIVLFENGDGLMSYIEHPEGYVSLADSDSLYFIETTPEK